MPHFVSPIPVTHLFARLDNLLIELLASLTREEWNAPTVAKLWTVKDVAAHLLDGNIRALSLQQDQYFGETPSNIASYQELVNWLNVLNADWVKASKRISPSVLILLHKATGKLATEYYESINLQEKAIFPVSWAGEAESFNWFHIAREYTEKWLHQQQIRDAVKKPGILTKEFFLPFMDTVVHAFPCTYQHVQAERGATIQLKVTGKVNGRWFLVKEEKWTLHQTTTTTPTATIEIEAETTWKLFSKSWTPENAASQIKIKGNMALGEILLQTVAFMA